MIKIEWTQELVHQTVEDQKKFFRTGETLDVNWRIAQLRKLKAAVKSHEASPRR